MKNTTLYSNSGAKFTCNGSVSMDRSKVAGRWAGDKRVVWVKRSELHTRETLTRMRPSLKF